MARINIHALVMGQTGAGKDTFAATFPKPMIVFFFDPIGKDLTYLQPHPQRGGEAVPQAGALEDVFDENGLFMYRYRDVQRADGLVRLTYFHSFEPLQPDGYSRFLRFMGEFHHQQDQWATIVLSSTTFMELEARKWHQYVLNPDAKDARQWFGGSTDALEEMLMMRFASIKSNLVVITHIDKDKDELHGEIVRNPSMPGRLRDRLASAFGEHYRVHVIKDDAGNRQRVLQTDNDGMYAAQSQIHAPNPCWPFYESLWDNWRE